MANTAPTFAPGGTDTLDGIATYTEGDFFPVVLDDLVQLVDAELAAQGHYAGATLTLARQGGADAADRFGVSDQFFLDDFLGTINFVLPVAGDVEVGTYSEGGGTITFTFNAEMTQERLDAFLSTLTYENTGFPDDAAIAIEWTFSDNEALEPLTTSGATTVILDKRTTVVEVAGNAIGDLGTGTAAVEHFIGVDLANPAKPWKLVSYAASTTGVSVDLEFNVTPFFVASGGDAEGDYFTDINAVAGGSNNDDLWAADVRSMLIGNGGDDFLTGGIGNDVLIGGPGVDDMFGGDGDDTLIFDSGDILTGGEGRDTAIVDAATAAGVSLILDDAMGIEVVLGAAFTDTFNASASTAGVTLYGRGGADSLTGGSARDILYGGVDGDVDTLDGGGGNDTLFFNTGDILIGGAGDDTAIADDPAGAGVAIVLGAGHGVETVLGGAGNDTLDASVSTLRIILDGRGGADTLIAGSGNDLLYFDAGDQLTGGGGTDIAVAKDPGNTGASVTIVAGVEIVYGGGGDDVLDASATSAFILDTRLSMFGGAGSDTLLGGAANDSLYGGAGADTLDGGGGNDVLFFTSGDTLIGGSGNDYGVAEDVGGASVVLGAASGIEALYGNVGGDTLDASAMTTRVTLDGRGGNDTVIGGSGSDFLFGGAGNDVITGGGGGDYFTFDDGFGTDVVTDFQDGQDRFDLTRINGLTSFDQLTIEEDGDDVVIYVTASPTDTITVLNATVAQFTAVDFYL